MAAVLAAVVGYLAVVGCLAAGAVLALVLSTSGGWRTFVGMAFGLAALVLVWLVGRRLGGRWVADRTVAVAVLPVPV